MLIIGLSRNLIQFLANTYHFNLKTLKNSKAIAESDYGPEGTFNDFQFDKPLARRIDYIFLSEGITVNKYAVLSDN